MKFKTSLFIIAVFTGVSNFCDANAKECGSGSYLMTGKCYVCPAGCFCTNTSTPMDPLNKISVTQSKMWCSGQISECPYKGSSGYGDCGDPAGGVNRCPEGYTSDNAASFIGMCYREEGNIKRFYNKGTCLYGQHLMYKACRECPAGCYCTNTSTAMDPDGKISNDQKAKWCRGEIASCDHKGINGYGDCGDPAGGVKRCPSGYTSIANSASVEDCFILVNSKRLYYKKITCEPGKYLPKGSDTCASCVWVPVTKSALTKIEGKGAGLKVNALQTNDTYYCPGVEDVYPSATSDQGRLACPSGTKPNSRNTDCENTDGTVTVNDTDSGNTGGQTGNIKVTPGNYLPANSTNPKTCVDIAGRKQYCPGGYFDKASYKQGMYDCPFGANATSDHAACELSLTKEQMMYGVAGGKSGNTTSACWLKTNAEDYKTCIYGVRVSGEQ